MQNLWQAWAVIAVVCLILELSSGDFFIICFSIGAVFSIIAAALGLGVYWQIAVFALFTLVSIFTVRPLALRYLHRGEEDRPSNADALMGREGRVVDAIPSGAYGSVQIDGDVWKATSADREALAAGERVRVVARESIIITVERMPDVG